MKPDWQDAPEWANYLAMDEDGSWYWYKDKPNRKSYYWNSSSYTLARKQTHWEDSLEQRP